MTKQAIIEKLDELFTNTDIIQADDLLTINNVSHAIGVYHGILSAIEIECDQEYARTGNRAAYSLFHEIHDMYQNTIKRLMDISDNRYRRVRKIYQ